ncbi:MAG TPA: flagellar basal body-associated FliL family protein [Caldimonas sp.]|jgi:flagellar protein FliL|nr:flagellar basal body-associated FliL family protein [Caldimonas sp.]
MSAVMAEPAADAAPARRPKKKVIVIGAVVLVLLVALAAGAIVFVKQRAARAAAAGDDESAAAETAASTAGHIDPKNVPIYLPLDPFIVNLADREADRYAQIGITFEMESNGASEQIKAFMPAIRNTILLILANKTSKELMYREGKELLAQEILREAVRPMGIEVATPEPVTPAPSESASAAASGAAAAASRPKARRGAVPQHNPIVRVHFSSFIIQ